MRIRPATVVVACAVLFGPAAGWGLWVAGGLNSATSQSKQQQGSAALQFVRDCTPLIAKDTPRPGVLLSNFFRCR